jgi:hypothetical protein
MSNGLRCSQHPVSLYLDFIHGVYALHQPLKISIFGVLAIITMPNPSEKTFFVTLGNRPAPPSFIRANAKPLGVEIPLNRLNASVVEVRGYRTSEAILSRW